MMMLICLVLFINIATLCNFSQLTNLFLNFCRYWSNQEFFFWFYINFIFTDPSPKFRQSHSIFGIELNKIWYNTSKYLRVCLVCSPLINELSCLCVVECECFKIINSGRIFKDTCSYDGQPNGEYLWLDIFLIVSST